MPDVKKPWDGYTKPFKIFGNLYFVGTVPASTHIIDTGEGLIMLDSGYQHSLYLVIHNMHILGLNPLNIKYIVHTHGHIDHMEATKALVELTGAKTFIGRPDVDFANGKVDLSFAKELDMEYYTAFEPDVILDDGDKISLGNTEITARSTPGHTPGAMSYFFDVSDGERTYRAALHGGMGLNTFARAFLESYGLSLDCRQNFVDAMDRLKNEKVDIYLGNHAYQNKTVEKYERMRNGEKDVFIDPKEWKIACESAKGRVLDIMKEEQT